MLQTQKQQSKGCARHPRDDVRKEEVVGEDDVILDIPQRTPQRHGQRLDDQLTLEVIDDVVPRLGGLQIDCMMLENRKFEKVSREAYIRLKSRRGNEEIGSGVERESEGNSD